MSAAKCPSLAFLVVFFFFGIDYDERMVMLMR